MRLARYKNGRILQRVTSSLSTVTSSHLIPGLCTFATPIRQLHTKMTSEQKKNVYPGLGLSIEHDNTEEYDHRGHRVFYPIGARGSGVTYDILPVREVAMMLVMDRLTDKPDWQRKIFDDEITAKWRAEALAWPEDDLWSRATRGKSTDRDQPHDETPGRADMDKILNHECFDFVLGELRKKAEYFEKTGLIPTLDVGPSVVKSDTIVPKDLHDEVREAFNTLKRDQQGHPDWHPGTDEKVRNLVHPSMYPLVYDVSRVIQDEVVGVEDAISKWSGKGEVITPKKESEAQPRARFGWNNRAEGNTWSSKFQWLPSNVQLNDDGSVKFTSYINGLHPEKYPQIYRTLEKLVEKAIPAWDQCVCEAENNNFQAKGRKTSRIDLGDYCDSNGDNWSPNEAPSADFIAAFDKTKIDYYNYYLKNGRDECIAEEVWKLIREPVQPAPKPNDFDKVNYAVDPDSTLFAKYRDTGLQVIVKMASIELTPMSKDKLNSSWFPFGSWHVEGQMNERIVGTALFYSDCENITESSLEFRAQTEGTYLNDTLDKVGQDEYSWMESIFGAQLGGSGSPGIQNWGDVVTKEGRLLAFPNIFQHRVRPFKLADPKKPGYRNFIALWLVDPSVRIISTANVPPQRQDWWMESITGQAAASEESTSSDVQQQASTSNEAKMATSDKPTVQDTQFLGTRAPALAKSLHDKLPAELVFDVSKRLAETNALPMTEEEAKGYRLELMDVRSKAKNEIEEAWQDSHYSFCEH